MAPWTWVRPADPSVLDGRPLLDLGTGDAQTLAALVGEPGAIVGLDRSPDALRAAQRSGLERAVCGDAARMPFADTSFPTILAGDLFHHFADAELESLLLEVRRVLRPEGLLVAWWYSVPGRPGADAPRYPRSVPAVLTLAKGAGLTAEELGLDVQSGSPATVGMVARR